jgi:hypothetical protein
MMAKSFHVPEHMLMLSSATSILNASLGLHCDKATPTEPSEYHGAGTSDPGEGHNEASDLGDHIIRLENRINHWMTELQAATNGPDAAAEELWQTVAGRLSEEWEVLCSVAETLNRFDHDFSPRIEIVNNTIRRNGGQLGARGGRREGGKPFRQEQT